MKGWKMALPLALSLLSPNLAAATGQRASMAVSYADLDLSQQGDARRLHARVRSAIRKICVQPRQGVLASPAETICRRTAMARAQDQIDRAVTLAADRQNSAQIHFATAAGQ